MVALLATCVAILLVSAGEILHARRLRRVATLAFGPARRPALWALLAPTLRVIACAALTWGLTELYLLVPKAHAIAEIPASEFKNLLLILDVSPSMKLTDAGPTQKQSRTARTADILKSFFERSPMEYFKTTVVAVYTEAKPVVLATSDREVVRNILTDLPMQYAFKPGPTDLFAGLTEAAKIAQPWRPKSTTLVIVTDGDTIPPTGMPKMPDSIAHTLVVGVGDPNAGRFIDGHQSRQDASTLRQLAVRMGGNYHNGNEKHIATDLLKQVTFFPAKSVMERLSKREYALMAIALGATLLAALPVLLHYFGTTWRPGIRRKSASRPLELAV